MTVAGRGGTGLTGRRTVVDLAIGAVVTVFAVTVLAFELGEGKTTSTALALGVVVAAGGGIAVRRHSPTLVLAAVIAARVLVAWDTGSELALLPAAVVALYTVARHGDRKISLATAIAAGAIMSVLVAALDEDAFVLELVGEGAQMLLPIAIADAARTRSDRIRDLINTEAEARVQAERLRIARDLHDVVAHGLSTIAIQSGVAAHLVERDPLQAKEALEIINATGKSSLEELRSMVGVLRSTDDAPLRPTPSDPNDIGDLTRGAEKAGIDLSTSITGAFPADVSDSAVVAMHRIIQEALTNITRHAGAVPTRLTVRHGDTSVEISVANDPSLDHSPSKVPSTGVGIVGMRERAEALGGSLEADHGPDGGFEVTATVPYYRRTQ